MRKIYQFIISIALMLFFLIGTGPIVAYACSCAGEMVQKHNCCPEQQHQQPSLHHHKNLVSSEKKEAELKQFCFCSTTPEQSLTSKSEYEPVVGKDLVLKEHLAHNPVIFPMAQSHQKPIWLRQTFYPDKSKLYLDSQHLLL